MSHIDLAEAIQNLREQLSEAVKASANSELRFNLGPIEMELQVVASREAGAKGGVKWLLFEAGADAKLGATQTQTLKLVLQPVNTQGQPIQVNAELDRRPE
ncbi:MAG: hypothetical protein GYB33_06670 [Gammaproteobacteria bacterium]|uniref:trypco2 family protein n=1 Tax=Pseudomaricurvus alcaniphilus TaxID=1166482 RepID=UPI00140D9DF5|nr:trypco2 family protein [Pseudomaricurvus alcaniphilus]MBR9910023.1 hypothetical protein [Gammaproteobacteria bacterium]NHN36481.1 hypothetical protein [Pseudomaricurvus alcaniphilus]